LKEASNRRAWYFNWVLHENGKHSDAWIKAHFLGLPMRVKFQFLSDPGLVPLSKLRTVLQAALFVQSNLSTVDNLQVMLKYSEQQTGKTHTPPTTKNPFFWPPTMRCVGCYTPCCASVVALVAPQQSPWNPLITTCGWYKGSIRC
jgi:hypothetical protein